MTQTRHVLGIDIGGTKLAAGVVAADGTLVCAERIPSQATDGPDRIVARIVEMCHRLMHAAALDPGAIAAVGIGCPGLIDAERGIVRLPGNLPGWECVPLAAMVSEGLKLPTYLENDANAGALGEHRFGAGRGAANMIYLTISTGIGGGIILDNRLHRGENGGAGEIGHMIIRYNGRLCACGRLGCLEAYASGTALAARAREGVQMGEQSVLGAGPDPVTGQAVVEAVRAGDAFAKRVWQEAISALAAGLASLIHIFNPGRIVLGGGLTNAGDLLFVPLRRQALGLALPPLAAVCEIVPAELGDQSGVLGAAAVAIERRATSA